MSNEPWIDAVRMIQMITLRHAPYGCAFNIWLHADGADIISQALRFFLCDHNAFELFYLRLGQPLIELRIYHHSQSLLIELSYQVHCILVL